MFYQNYRFPLSQQSINQPYNLLFTLRPFTTASLRKGILLVRFNAEDLKLRLSELGLHVTLPPSSEGTPQGSDTPLVPPVLLDLNEAHQMFLNSGLMSDVLPNATIVQDWQPFKPLPSNMAILLKKVKYYIIMRTSMEISWLTLSCLGLQNSCNFLQIPMFPRNLGWKTLGIRRK